ncbi:unnamed protein product [Prorocentrum cordatum]|uniref:C3H1-type domain-containing protein n=1 Tax=Prorocentrum cordatum TaxID=2364126 RepID=A0ABN9TLA5_9DINO|nr:unnamed protein product [Polarella glacialis]
MPAATGADGLCRAEGTAAAAAPTGGGSPEPTAAAAAGSTAAAASDAAEAAAAAASATAAASAGGGGGSAPAVAAGAATASDGAGSAADAADAADRARSAASAPVGGGDVGGPEDAEAATGGCGDGAGHAEAAAAAPARKKKKRWLCKPPPVPSAAWSATNPLVKSQMCWYEQNGKTCAYGSACNFAHSVEELRRPLPTKAPDAALCPFFQVGCCWYDSNCFNAHELAPRDSGHKTALCADFATSGHCAQGAACRGAHGQQELRAPLAFREMVGFGYKASLCTLYVAPGLECEDDNCFDAHGPFDLRRRPLIGPAALRGAQRLVPFGDAHVHLDHVLLSRAYGSCWFYKRTSCQPLGPAAAGDGPGVGDESVLRQTWHKPPDDIMREGFIGVCFFECFIVECFIVARFIAASFTVECFVGARFLGEACFIVDCYIARVIVECAIGGYIGKAYFIVACFLRNASEAHFIGKREGFMGASLRRCFIVACFILVSFTGACFIAAYSFGECYIAECFFEC